MLPFLTVRILVSIVALVILTIGALVYTVFRIEPASPAPPIEVQDTGPVHAVIGISVEQRAMSAYTYGTGGTHLVFVGGIHGGYEWNSVVLAYAFIDYLNTHPDIVPKNLKLTIIPSANPDGVYKIVGKEGRFTIADVPSSADQQNGRFNARGVDLNRNFDCKWQPESTWRQKVVSAGERPFSEPEAAALRDFIVRARPAAVVFWHSQANGVYASQCENGILPKTLDMMNIYAQAAGYPAFKTFDAYATTGAAEDWLAALGIPAITVELSTHETIEWEKNLAGVKAVLDYFE